MNDWKQLLPNTFMRAKESFFLRCETDEKFREEMIEMGILELKHDAEVEVDE